MEPAFCIIVRDADAEAVLGPMADLPGREMLLFPTAATDEAKATAMIGEALKLLGEVASSYNRVVGVEKQKGGPA